MPYLDKHITLLSIVKRLQNRRAVSHSVIFARCAPVEMLRLDRSLCSWSSTVEVWRWALKNGWMKKEAEISCGRKSPTLRKHVRDANGFLKVFSWSKVGYVCKNHIARCMTVRSAKSCSSITTRAEYTIESQQGITREIYNLCEKPLSLREIESD